MKFRLLFIFIFSLMTSSSLLSQNQKCVNEFVESCYKAFPNPEHIQPTSEWITDLINFCEEIVYKILVMKTDKGNTYLFSIKPEKWDEWKSYFSKGTYFNAFIRDDEDFYHKFLMEWCL